MTTHSYIQERPASSERSYLKLLNHLLPAPFTEQPFETLRRARLGLGLTLICVISNLLCFPYFGLTLGWTHHVTLFTLFLFLLYSTNILLFWRFQSLKLMGALLVGGLFTATASSLFFEASFTEELRLMWFAPVPLFGMLLLGQRAATLSLVACVAVLGAYYSTNTSSSAPLSFMLMSSFCLILFGMAWIFDSINRDTLAELAKARDTADEANQAKSVFLANMSHEIRTPLNAVLGYSELLQEEALEAGMRRMIPDLQKIHLAGNNLLVLISDILDLSKIEAGKLDLHIKQVSLSSLLRELRETMQPQQEKNQNAFTLEVAPGVDVIHTDPNRLRQCLFNLLGNAFKFTQRGEVSLAVSFTKDADDGTAQVCFVVSDTGIGIPKEEQGKLFQEFKQANAFISRRYGGTGLGLAITKKLAELLGGSISLESEAGKGATFTLILPMKKQ